MRVLKKINLIIALCLLLCMTNSVKGFNVDSLSQSYSGGVLSVYMKISHTSYFDFSSINYQNLDDTLTFDVCLTQSVLPVLTTKDTIIEITMTSNQIPNHYVVDLYDNINCSNFISSTHFPLTITSVDEKNLSINNKINLYPNPSSNILVIENLSNQKNDLTLEIRNITGKLELVKNIGSFEKVTINTDQISSGIYFISIKDDESVLATKKWVKTVK